MKIFAHTIMEDIMTFLLQLQTNTELNINKVKKTLSNNKIKSIKVSNSELYCFANLSLNEIKLILVNNINSNEIVHLYEFIKKTMIKVQLSIINNEQMNKINTKFNTWQGYCKYLDEKIDKVEIRLNAKIDEIKEQMVTKEELKLVKDEIMSSVAIQIQSLKETIKEEIMSSVTIQIQSLKETIKDEIASVIKTEIKGLRN